MHLMGMMMTPESNELTQMFATYIMSMAPAGFHGIHVFMILKVEDFTVYVSVFWGFQVRGFHTVGQNCSAESKDWRISGEMLCGTVPHREVHIVIGSFSSSRSYDPLYSFHSERGKVTVLTLELVEDFIGLFSVELGILKEIPEYRTVFGVPQR